MTTQRIEFTGRNTEDITKLGAGEARSLFLDRFFTDFLKFLNPEEIDMLDEDIENWSRLPKASNIWHTFKEIIKNIYDHNGG